MVSLGTGDPCSRDRINLDHAGKLFLKRIAMNIRFPSWATANYEFLGIKGMQDERIENQGFLKLLRDLETEVQEKRGYAVTRTKEGDIISCTFPDEKLKGTFSCLELKSLILQVFDLFQKLL